jgi:hypothetical protein
MTIHKYSRAELLNPMLLLYAELGDSREISRQLRASRSDLRETAAEARSSGTSALMQFAETYAASVASGASDLDLNETNAAAAGSMINNFKSGDTPAKAGTELVALDGAAESLKAAEDALTEARQTLIHPTEVDDHPSKRA